MIKVGTLSDNYAARRLFLNLIEDCEYKNYRFYNAFLWENFYKILQLKLGKQVDIEAVLYNFRFIPGVQKPDILHLFNTLSFTKGVPVVLHVESVVPWVKCITEIVESEEADFTHIKNNPTVLKNLELVSSPDYKQLLGLSKVAEKMCRELFLSVPNYEYLCRKITTIELPQTTLLDDISKKIYLKNNIVNFIFVGQDFYRKGGYEMLKVLTDLKKTYNFHLDIISTFRIDDIRYVNDQIINHTRELIGKGSEWITYKENLPNYEVLEMLKNADVAFLPTFMDTYAYSVLECEAAGVPVITTNIRALSDINGNDKGWLINVPQNRLKHPIINTSENVEKYRRILYDGLYNIVESILRKPELIKQKGESAYKYIKEVHNPVIYKESLRSIYQKAIGE